MTGAGEHQSYAKITVIRGSLHTAFYYDTIIPWISITLFQNLAFGKIPISFTLMQNFYTSRQD